MTKIVVECGTSHTVFEPTQAELDAGVREAAEDFLTAASEHGVSGDPETLDALDTLINAVNLAIKPVKEKPKKKII
jgi:hypothetical protein